MAVFSISGVRIKGLSACVPEQIVHNKDYKWISEKERMLLIKTTGVVSRRVIKKGTTTSDLCIAAADKLLKEMGLGVDGIDLLVFVSQTRDYPIPSTASIVQNRMKMPKSSMAFDINMGCSGYVYGLSSVVALMSSGNIQRALLLVGDISTANISYRDKSTYPLFGDAGTATILELDDKVPAMYFNMQSDGEGYDAIMVHDGGMKNLASRDSLRYRRIGDGIYRNNIQLALDGIKVFNFALREVVPNIRELLEKSGKKLEEADYVILHQANLLINETIRKKLKITNDKVPLSLDRFGNTSCASIPLTMCSNIAEDLRRKKVNLILSGFGVGLSWGSAWIETDKITVPDIIEY